VGEQTTETITVVATDPQSDPLAYFLTQAPAGMTIGAPGLITWTPSEAQGPGSYPVTIRVEEQGNSASFDLESFTITVNEVNLHPVAVDDTLTVVEGGTATTLVGGATSLIANDTDADIPANTLTVDPTPVTGPLHGTLTLNANGTFELHSRQGRDNQ